MQHLCKIELAGRVGAVRIMDIQGSVCVRFGLGVDSGGGGYIHTDWFNCVWWANSFDDAYKVERGKEVHLEGRIISSEYEKADGSTGLYYEVKVNKIW